MRRLAAIVALTAAIGRDGLAAESRPEPDQVPAQGPAVGAPQDEGGWHLDVASGVFHESWDFNGSSEWLSGATLGVERQLCRPSA